MSRLTHGTRAAKPLVSVVMSVLDDEAHVERSTRSILEQSYRRLELIVVNDGSTDATSTILQRLREEDTRLRVIDQKNTGLTRALVRGCREAKGDFIARQDSDDWSHPERISALVASFSGHDAAVFASSAVNYVAPCGSVTETIARRQDPGEATNRLRFYSEGPPAHGSVMFRKSAYERVGGYREAFYYAQDSDLWLRLAEIGFIVYCPEVLYNYSVNLQSISAQKRHLQERFGKLGRLCHDARSSGRSEAQFLSQAKELTEQIRSGAHTGRHGATEVHTTRYLIGTQLARQGNVRALRYLLPIVLRQPWNVKVWFRIVQAVAGRKTKIVGQ